MDELIAKFMSKSDSEIEAYITAYATKNGVTRQLNWINGIFGKTWRGGTPHVTLADTILRDQKSKIEKWGEKAYPLSEKQIAAIVRELRTRYDVAVLEKREA